MSLPETLNWCDTHQAGHIGTCDYPNVAVRVAGRDDLLIRREADGSWPDWVLVGLGWELDDSHDLSAVMDGVWRERPRAAAEGGETDA